MHLPTHVHEQHHIYEYFLVATSPRHETVSHKAESPRPAQRCKFIGISCSHVFAARRILNQIPLLPWSWRAYHSNVKLKDIALVAIVLKETSSEFDCPKFGSTHEPYHLKIAHIQIWLQRLLFTLLHCLKHLGIGSSSDVNNIFELKHVLLAMKPVCWRAFELQEAWEKTVGKA